MLAIMDDILRKGIISMQFLDLYPQVCVLIYAPNTPFIWGEYNEDEDGN